MIDSLHSFCIGKFFFRHESLAIPVKRLQLGGRDWVVDQIVGHPHRLIRSFNLYRSGQPAAYG